MKHVGSNTMCNLAEHGDSIERYNYPLFIETRFPSYEDFWKREVIPVTNRQQPFYKTDEELYALGKTPLNLYLAYLHYSVLFHLGTAFGFVLIHDEEMEYTKLMYAMTMLVAAQDVAFKLLTWWEKRSDWDTILEECKTTTNGNLMASFEKKAKPFAKNWRHDTKKTPAEIRDIASYRNAMVHRGVRTIMLIYNVSWFPKIGKENEYCDWRQVKDENVVDYAPASGILWPAWKQTAEYFEKQWRDVLLK
jgi:hypothetical protein